ncbi:hypothetical protein HMPREF0541_01784 [Lacticaseibacillus rhamnosus ATCC 21052]|nr:hypothetical protein HMPREF0541_01784 [Lacticaseibacillus rhamnosus ATCC 21052]
MAQSQSAIRHGKVCQRRQNTKLNDFSQKSSQNTCASKGYMILYLSREARQT